MIDQTILASALLEQLKPEQLRPAYIALSNLAQVATMYPAKFSNLSETQMRKMLDQALICPEALKNAILILHRQKSIKLLPKLLTALDRQLSQHDIKVVKIDYAKASIDEEKIKNVFGKNCIIVANFDPDLLAGTRLTIDDQTCEFSLRQQLNQISLSLNKTN